MIYDLFQQKAIDYINSGHSVIVSAPTGAGKTAIAEHIISNSISKNEKVIYTAPIKALSNQKFRDFQHNFKDKIGILTGDVSINPSAPILIMTTEIFRNKLLEKENTLNGYSWVIFDEIHYLDNYERGTVWEESLIFLPKHMKILALSATMPNIMEFSDWIKSIHGIPLKTVEENNRPVPLHFFYQCQGVIVDDISRLREFMRKNIKRSHIKPNRPIALIKNLYENNRLPCIYFVFGRRRCEYLAGEINEFNFLNTEERQRTSELYKKLCLEFELTNDKSAIILERLIEKGIAYHHAGMLPTLKEVVERLFTSRLIKVIFTTETFALGINMPARTVVFDELRKFYGHYYGTLKTRDFYQMAGRAGRRGIDKEGFVYSRVNPHDTSFEELKNIVHGRPEKVCSRFNASYATLLNLYEKYSENLYEIYGMSFHYTQQPKRSREKALGMLHSKVRLLKEFNLISDNRLTEKGRFASKVYGYELLLSELYSNGALEKLSVTDLATLSLALVFEPKKGTVKPPLNKRAKILRDITAHIAHHIQYMERRSGITPLSKECFYHLTPVLLAWMRKENFDAILRYSNVDEGEVIRYFRMTIQILREILESGASAELRENTKKAIELINRDVIDAERQLRR